MSKRPPSRKGVKKLTPKQQIKELTEKNEQLTAELEALKASNEETLVRLETLVNKIVSGFNDKEKKETYKLAPDVVPMTLSTDLLVEMVSRMIIRKEVHSMSVEARAMELETRVTRLNMDLARMTKKTLAYENGLEDMTKCPDMEAVRDRVFQLQVLAGEQYHVFSAHEAASRPPQPRLDGVDEQPDSTIKKSLENAVQLNLQPPRQKFPGSTHINNMYRDLRLYVLKELSHEKASGADWRMLAERVGINVELTEYWRSLKLQCPAGRVLAEWGQSTGASVRLLHRHLMSPQMRCTILGKKVADFYDVM